MGLDKFCESIKNRLEFAGSVEPSAKFKGIEVTQKNKGHELRRFVPYIEISTHRYPHLIIDKLIQEFSSLHQFSD